MPLVPAKCPECGGNINIDAEKKAAICEFCKQPFVVEEAINNFNTTYNITNHNDIKTDVVNVYENREKDFIIEAGKLVEYKGESANIVVPDSVRIIGHRAFLKSSIIEITIPKSVVKIEERVFEWCTELKKVTIEAESIEVLIDIFPGCSSLESIKHNGNILCNAESWENYRKSNFNEAIWCFSLKQSDRGTIEIPKGVKKIVNDSTIRGYSQNISMSGWAIDVRIPDSVEEIGEFAFSNKSFEKLILPNGLKKIGDSAFSGCYRLKNIVIPESVIEIGNNPFIGCTSLESIENHSSVTIEPPNDNSKLKIITEGSKRKEAIIEQLEQEVIKMREALSNNLCWECHQKVSLLRKCKTIGCKYHGKSLPEEISKIYLQSLLFVRNSIYVRSVLENYRYTEIVGNMDVSTMGKL